MRRKFIYSESEEFFHELDAVIKKNGTVTIAFKRERLSESSKLWPRLRKCSNWDEIETQLQNIHEGKTPPLSKAINHQLKVELTNKQEFWIYMWIATLVAGVLFYAIYKKCTVRVKGNLKSKDVEIIIAPTKAT